MKKVVIDTDFFKFITMDFKDEELFLKVMQELDYSPIMHEYVFTEELHEHSFAKKLVNNKHIEVKTYKAIIGSGSKEIEYKRLFKYSYHEMNGIEFDDSLKIEDYHHDKENLGEIHSIILAQLDNIDILMSNDGGAKNFVDNKLKTSRNTIKVINIERMFTELVTKDSSSLRWREIKKVVSQLKGTNDADERKYSNIRKFWVDENIKP